MRRRLTLVFVLLGALSSGCTLGGDEALDEWAAEACVITTRYETATAAVGVAREEFRWTPGDDELDRLIEVLGEAEGELRALVASVEAVEPPNDEVRRFQESQVYVYPRIAQLLDEFTSSMKEYRRTGDREMLLSAQASFDGAVLEKLAVLWGIRYALSDDVKRALNAVPNCGTFDDV